MTPKNPRAAATQQLNQIVTQSRDNAVKVVAVEEMACTGKSNSKVITLSLVSAAVVDINIPFGTPMGINGEYPAVPLSSSFPELIFANLASVTDNQGASVPFYQLLNKRFVRTPIFVSHIEVITPNTALGNSQKAEQVTRISVPYNSTLDSCASAGNFIPQFTEYTAVTILDAGCCIGEFSGFVYKLLAGSSVKLNIHIAAIDSNTFLYN